MRRETGQAHCSVRTGPALPRRGPGAGTQLSGLLPLHEAPARPRQGPWRSPAGPCWVIPSA